MSDSASASMGCVPAMQKRKKLLVGMSLFFTVFAVIFGLYYFFWAQFEVYTDNAYVKGNLVQLMPQISGTVVKVVPNDTDLVKQGQLLVRLDDADAKIALARTQAALAETVRQVSQHYLNAHYLEAILKLRAAEASKAKNDWVRRQKLAETASISAEDVMHARIDSEIAQAQQEAAFYQLAAEKALVQHTDVAHHPTVAAAEKAIYAACLALKRTAIQAPVTGYVANRQVQLGEQVTPATALLVIVPLDEIWVEANFRENQLRHMFVGQPVVIVSDLYGDKVKYRGKVAGFSGGTGSVFSLLPPQNATGNWIKVAQRVPVKIVFTNRKQLEEYPLRVGLSLHVTVDTRKHDKNLPVTSAVTEASSQNLEAQIADAQCQRLVDKIIADNMGSSP